MIFSSHRFYLTKTSENFPSQRVELSITDKSQNPELGSMLVTLSPVTTDPDYEIKFLSLHFRMNVSYSIAERLVRLHFAFMCNIATVPHRFWVVLSCYSSLVTPIKLINVVSSFKRSFLSGSWNIRTAILLPLTKAILRRLLHLL